MSTSNVEQALELARAEARRSPTSSGRLAPIYIGSASPIRTGP
ncbi:hypothetical protein [Nannocystis pusilla]